MASQDILLEVATREGWGQETAMDVALDYIDNQQNDDAFRDYVEERASTDA